MDTDGLTTAERGLGPPGQACVRDEGELVCRARRERQAVYGPRFKQAV